MLAQTEWQMGFVPRDGGNGEKREQTSRYPRLGPRREARANLPRDEGHRLLRRIGTKLRLWRQRIEDRTALAAMTSRDLRDIRLTRADVAAEIHKPFWRE